jgi:hypothetical protein
LTTSHFSFCASKLKRRAASLNCVAVNIYAPSSMKGNVIGFSINGHLRSVYRPVMSEYGDDHVELRGIITQFQRFSSS